MYGNSLAPFVNSGEHDCSNEFGKISGVQRQGQPEATLLFVSSPGENPLPLLSSPLS